MINTEIHFSSLYLCQIYIENTILFAFQKTAKASIWTSGLCAVIQIGVRFTVLDEGI